VYPQLGYSQAVGPKNLQYPRKTAPVFPDPQPRQAHSRLQNATRAVNKDGGGCQRDVCCTKTWAGQLWFVVADFQGISPPHSRSAVDTYPLVDTLAIIGGRSRQSALRALHISLVLNCLNEGSGKRELH
jgi:hypothetical protein